MKENCLDVEKDLLQGLQQNNEEALALLMKMYYDDLYNYAARFTKDNGLIKDCIQEVFISLWQRRESAGAILSPKYYFLRAIKNKVLKSLHKNVRKVTTDHLQEEYDFFHEFSIERVIIEKQISEEKAERLRKTLSLLSKRQIEIIYLKYYQYLDHGQIAELMNISRQSVYNLLHEAIHKLRSLWHSEFVAH
ncbi:MAG: sigma-70 family RNA polymerase sigma factor [Chitinophagaceae bacterium]